MSRSEVVIASMALAIRGAGWTASGATQFRGGRSVPRALVPGKCPRIVLVAATSVRSELLAAQPVPPRSCGGMGFSDPAASPPCRLTVSPGPCPKVNTSGVRSSPRGEIARPSQESLMGGLRVPKAPRPRSSATAPRSLERPAADGSTGAGCGSPSGSRPARLESPPTAGRGASPRLLGGWTRRTRRGPARRRGPPPRRALAPAARRGALALAARTGTSGLRPEPRGGRSTAPAWWSPRGSSRCASPGRAADVGRKQRGVEYYELDMDRVARSYQRYHVSSSWFTHVLKSA